MGFPKGEKKDIECIEIKVYRSAQHKSGETRLRLVSWVINGKRTDPSFEKRAFILREYNNEQQLQMSKAKGFNNEEIAFIAQHAAEIREDMSNFVSENPRQPQAAAPAPKQDKAWDEPEPVAEELFS